MLGQHGRVLADEIFVDDQLVFAALRWTKAALVRASICLASSRTALWRVMHCSSSSKMPATAKTSFSPMHRRLLS